MRNLREDRDLTQKEIDKLVANPNPSSHSI